MELKGILQESGFRFQKKFGQNFIADENLLQAIAQDAAVTNADTVVEIGAGAGTLTSVLSKRAKRVISFEIDPALKPVLQQTLAGADNVELLFCDVLQKPVSEIEQMAGGSYKVVANLPYYVTTPVIMRFLECGANMTSMTVMVQKEVADRLAAPAGCKDYGRISVAAQFFGSVKVMRGVDRRNFYPAPNVDSAVVRMDKDQKYDCDPALLRKIVKSAFSMRRKVLTTCLAGGMGMTKEQAAQALQKLGKPATVRGETLTVEEFVELTRIFANV